MASFDPPEPPFEPGEPTPPPELQVPLPPPEVGFGSPFVPADAENRDRILDWWRMWWRRVFFPWVAAFTAYWSAQWDRLAEYINTWITAADEYISEHAIAGYSWRTTATVINPTVGQTTPVTFTGVDQEHRPLVVGDLVSDQTFTKTFGIITALIDATHATVTTIGQLSGFNGHGWWVTVTAIAHAGTTPVVLVAEAGRPPQVGDFVMDQTASVAYGKITAVTDDTHVTVTYIGILQGPQGIQGIPGPQGEPGDPGVVQSIVAGPFITVDDTDPANPIVSGTTGGAGVDTIVAGTNITVDATDPNNPIVSATGGGGGGTVDSVVAGDNVTVDDTDPANPIVSAGSPGSALVESIVAGTNITVDDTDPANPIVSATGGGGGGTVDSVVAGDHITVDDTDPANPIVSAANGIPLNVFATIDRPPALEDGDAYFDSTLIIPVWSYGGVWRDSDSNVVPDPPEPDDVDNDGGSFGGVTGYRLSPGFDTINKFSTQQYVEFMGALYSGPVHSGPITPGDSDGNILLRFNGTTVTTIPVPGFITNLGYIETTGLWVIDDVLYLVVTTLDPSDDPTATYLLSYDGSSFTNLSSLLSPELAESYVRHIGIATDGSLYYNGETPRGSGTKNFYAADFSTTPVQVTGESVTAVYENYAVGAGGIAYNQTFEQVERIVAGEYSSTFETDLSGGYVFVPIGDVNNRPQTLLIGFTDPSERHLYGPSGLLGTPEFITMQHALGFYETGRVWIADPSDPMGDHVAFNLMFNGSMWAGATGVYLNGKAYIEVADDRNAYLAIVTVSV